MGAVAPGGGPGGEAPWWGSGQGPERRTRVPVLLPYPLPGPFDYSVPPHLSLLPGDIVVVPLGRREEVGVVWDAAHGAPEPKDASVPDHRLRPVISVVQSPPMREDLRRLVDWMAAYTLSPPGEVMRMALRVLRPEGGPIMGWRRLTPPEGARITDARRRVLDALARTEPRTTLELAKEAGVSAAVMRGLESAGLIAAVPLPSEEPFPPPDPDHPGPDLSPDQRTAAEALRRTVAARAFAVTLLDGVTGSGKTEVYFEAVAECAAPHRRQVLILLAGNRADGAIPGRASRARFGVPPGVNGTATCQPERTAAGRRIAPWPNGRGAGGGGGAVIAVPAVSANWAA